MKKIILTSIFTFATILGFAQEIKKAIDKNGNFFLEKDGKRIVKDTFEKVGYYNQDANLIPAKLGGKWGFYDNVGKLVIPHQFEGLVFQNESEFVIKVDEYKKSKYDGLFEMNISKNDSLLIGNWVAYNPKELKDATRKYQLQKKIFKYNPNNKVDELFINDDKFNTLKYKDTIDGEVVENEFEEYFTNTEKLYEKNASIDELTSDFVSNLSKADIFILRNSIFARHGFAFRDKQLRMYFEQFDWYMPVFGDVKDELTEVEKRNIDLLLRYEQNAEEYYDTFGR